MSGAAGIFLGCWLRPWTVDLLKIYQIGSQEASPVPDATLDSRLTEGITNLEHSAPGVSLDSGPMEGMLCLEPSEQSVLNSSLVARPTVQITFIFKDFRV